MKHVGFFFFVFVFVLFFTYLSCTIYVIFCVLYDATTQFELPLVGLIKLLT